MLAPLLLAAGLATAEARPLVTVRTTFGMLPVVAVWAEIQVHDAWSVEVGGGWNLGLIPPQFFLGTRWRPDRLTWGQPWQRHTFSIAPGLLAGTYRARGGAGLTLVPDVELAYVFTTKGGVHVFFGGRLGVGATTEVGGGRDWTRIEPMLQILPISVGVGF